MSLEVYKGELVFLSLYLSSLSELPLPLPHSTLSPQQQRTMPASITAPSPHLHPHRQARWLPPLPIILSGRRHPPPLHPRQCPPPQPPSGWVRLGRIQRCGSSGRGSNSASARICGAGAPAAGAVVRERLLPVRARKSKVSGSLSRMFGHKVQSIRAYTRSLRIVVRMFERLSGVFGHTTTEMIFSNAPFFSGAGVNVPRSYKRSGGTVVGELPLKI